jgi:hypothetical protein
MLPPLAPEPWGSWYRDPWRGGSNPTVGKKKFDHQYQAVASNITPSMEKKPLMSWTWAQLSNNQRTSIAILINGK